MTAGNEQILFETCSNRFIEKCQLFAAGTVLVFCLVNLSLSNSDKTLWTNLIIGCFGFLLPSPLYTGKAPKLTSPSKNTDNGLPGQSVP